MSIAPPDLHLANAGKRFDSFYHLWKERVEEAPDAPFIHVTRPQETRVLKYSYTAFFKRAQRHAIALRAVLGLEPGDTVALCVEDLNDFALLVHGALLAHLVIVPVTHEATPSELGKILKAAAPKVFFFPHAFSASVATLLTKAPSVKHWVVTGRDRQEGPRRTAENEFIQQLDRVLVSIVGEEFEEPEVSESTPCGVVFSPGGKFLSASHARFFTREQVLQKGWLSSQVIGHCVQSGNLWTSASELTPVGFLFNFFLSLYHPSPVLIRPGFHEREFWPQMLADDIQFAELTIKELEVLFRKGKPRGWRKPQDFSVLVSDEVRLDQRVLAHFQERFFVPVGVSFFARDIAEYVSLRHPEDTDLHSIRGESGEVLPSFGHVLGEAKVIESDLPGLKAENQYRWGELSLWGACGGKPIVTDIRAAILDTGESRQLYVVGKRSELVVRKGRLINLERVNTLIAQLQGVVYGRAVPFDHPTDGQDFIMYVMLHRLSKMNKYDIEFYLAEHLKRQELPSSIVIEGRVGLDPPLDEKELRTRAGL
jgi:acyl-CoA synthetase (AMP-forming)/AMP-acid ligase II